MSARPAPSSFPVGRSDFRPGYPPRLIYPHAGIVVPLPYNNNREAVQALLDTGSSPRYSSTWTAIIRPGRGALTICGWASSLSYVRHKDTSPRTAEVEQIGCTRQLEWYPLYHGLFPLLVA